MTVLRSVAAAMVLFTLGASPVFAKVAFQDPGLYSFYRPNPHLMNGVPTPAVAINVATDTSFMRFTRHIDRSEKRAHAAAATAAHRAPRQLYVDDPWADLHAYRGLSFPQRHGWKAVGAKGRLQIDDVKLAAADPRAASGEQPPLTRIGVSVKIQVRRLAIALAIAGPLAVAATVKSSAAPINGMSVKATVPAVTTDVRYRAHRDNRYPLDWGYPTYNNYGYPDYSTYSRSWGYPRGGSAVHVGNGGLRGAQASIGSVGVSAADASYCRQRWAYYDAEAGKYMGDDGEWRPCP